MGRPSNPRLSAEKIADAALELIEEVGDVQMVLLAEKLMVPPSSLYGHVRGRKEVIDLARLRLLEQLAPLADAHDWRTAVEGLFRQLVDTYTQHRRLLPLIFATTVTAHRALAVYEPVFAALLAGGFRPDQLRLTIALIEAQALGLAFGLPEPAMTDEIRAAFPAYTASIVHSRHDRAAATDFAAETILRGLESQLHLR